MISKFFLFYYHYTFQSASNYTENQTFILSCLIKTPHIQKILVVDYLMKDLKNSERRIPALAALNRMDNLIAETDAFYKLIEMYNMDGK